MALLEPICLADTSARAQHARELTGRVAKIWRSLVATAADIATVRFRDDGHIGRVGMNFKF
jgi:hypothetical protein